MCCDDGEMHTSIAHMTCMWPCGNSTREPCYMLLLRPPAVGAQRAERRKCLKDAKHASIATEQIMMIHWEGIAEIVSNCLWGSPCAAFAAPVPGHFAEGRTVAKAQVWSRQVAYNAYRPAGYNVFLARNLFPLVLLS